MGQESGGLLQSLLKLPTEHWPGLGLIRRLSRGRSAPKLTQWLLSVVSSLRATGLHFGTWPHGIMCPQSMQTEKKTERVFQQVKIFCKLITEVILLNIATFYWLKAMYLSKRTAQSHDYQEIRVTGVKSFVCDKIIKSYIHECSLHNVYNSPRLDNPGIPLNKEIVENHLRNFCCNKMLCVGVKRRK